MLKNLAESLYTAIPALLFLLLAVYLLFSDSTTIGPL